MKKDMIWTTRNERDYIQYGKTLANLGMVKTEEVEHWPWKGVSDMYCKYQLEINLFKSEELVHECFYYVR